MVERIVTGPLHTNAYIVSTGKKECVLIDPGPDPDIVLSRLELLNMIPRAILLTHGHLDHIASSRAIQEAYADRKIEIKVGIHPLDLRYVSHNAREVHAASFAPYGPKATQAFEKMYTDPPRIDFTYDTSEAVMDLDLMVIHTPGHSAGSVVFFSEERSAVFTGDTLVFTAIGSTDQEDSDESTLLDSIKTKLFVLPPETRVFPGHGPVSTIERELQNNTLAQSKRIF
jgi:hydroxyacylglutathione hydrolase